jgi:hypothetical protein
VVDDDDGGALWGRHGLAGKQSNRALKAVQEDFVEFIIANRSPVSTTTTEGVAAHGNRLEGGAK